MVVVMTGGFEMQPVVAKADAPDDAIGLQPHHRPEDRRKVRRPPPSQHRGVQVLYRPVVTAAFGQNLAD